MSEQVCIACGEPAEDNDIFCYPCAVAATGYDPDPDDAYDRWREDTFDDL